MSGRSLELRDVRGPTALGGGRQRALELLYLMALTEFRRTYLGTVLGYLWSLGRPLLLFSVLLTVFTQAFDLGDRVTHYPVLLLFNIVLFSFFQEATTQAVSSIVTREAVVRKTQFPRLVIPLAVVLTAVFNLAVNLVVVFVFLLAAGIDPDVVLARVAAHTRGAVRADGGRVGRRGSPVPALPRYRDRLGRAGHGALLRDAGALSDRHRLRNAARPDRAQPTRTAVRARAQMGDRPDALRARSPRRTGRSR